ncbi:transcriptional regulator (plasmid) [Amycolatopsis sp. AA4]|uniref:helix-turn-helix domain-containing protein n=1 Tax=Actinomycetes TaxID=1760 RepID=UPI0001B556CB|nr:MULTISPECIES: helix-turn-helix transcriptional regulator [Actinomycetes]ATY17048.1 transcriptional regulator [Amycolatopsis sp. AA4]
MHNDDDWLSSRVPAEFKLNTSLLPEALTAYRNSRGLTQTDLAKLLGIHQTYLSKIESGHRKVFDIELILRIASQLELDPEELGIARSILEPVTPPANTALVGLVDGVQESQNAWRHARRRLNKHRGELAQASATLYDAEARIGNAPFLALERWMPSSPLPLSDISLEWSDSVEPVPVTGTEPEAHGVLPLRAPGRRFTRYTTAIKYLDPPALFENRSSYRLLDCNLRDPRPAMRFTLGSYFDKLDVSEAIAHELSASPSCQADPPKANWAELPLRGLIGNPFDLSRRALMPAIETLTIRRSNSGEPTFLLHWRDPQKVATAGGIYGLIPAGEFQPSTIATRDRENDFDLWKNIVREYAEEVLGEPERDGSQAEPIDYGSWPFYAHITAGIREGAVSAYCLGMGMDALTLTATILTVVVFDSATFDSLFSGAVDVNPEGVLMSAAGASKVTDGLPFNEITIKRLLSDEPMASPGACILDRAWRFRDQLLP